MRRAQLMSRHRSIAILWLVLDVLATLLVFNLVSHFRGAPIGQQLVFAVPIAVLVFAIFLIQGYSPRTDMLSIDYASQHVISLVGAMLATLLLTFAISPGGFELAPQSSRIVIALSFLALIPLTLGYRRLVYLRLSASREKRSFIFLGDPASCAAFRDECGKMQLQQRILFAVVNVDSIPPFSVADDLELRPFRDVLAEVRVGRLAVEAIILRETARELEAGISQQLVQLYFAGVPTYTLELFHQIYWQKIPLYRLNQTWLFQEGFQIAREPVFERLKRVTDIVLSLFALVLAAPMIALAGLVVWLEDRGPVFFFQQRVGKNHVPFSLVKLRTMRDEPRDGDLYTQKNDPRITRAGGFLRASRLDELPQLWNVLRGEMSLIGPRAEWVRLVESYEREIPCYHFRHLVKPGITGWAQVNYPYGASTDDTLRKLEYDLYYIRHFSFLLDATIALKTIHIMLFGKGR